MILLAPGESERVSLVCTPRGGGAEGGAMAAEDTTALLRASEVYPVFELFCRYWGLHSIPECYIWSTCGVREKELNEGMRGGKGVSGVLSLRMHILYSRM